MTRNREADRLRVKVCGLTRLEDAELAARLGADAVGFVLWERSPRHISARGAAAIAARLPAFMSTVGVVVDASPGEVDAAVRTAGLDVVQLHGREAVSAYRSVPARIVKALAVETDEDVAAALDLPAEVTVLVDAVHPTARGGTGQKADWTRAAEIARRRPLILAGGLTAQNVTEAVRSVRPWAVDVSSGVEESPGIKSARRMEAFFAALEGIRGEEFKMQDAEFKIPF